MKRLELALVCAVALLGAGCSGQTQDCSKYVDCLDAQFPGNRAQLDSTYGPNGSCWTGSATTASTCTDQCKAGLAAARQSTNPPAACL